MNKTHQLQEKLRINIEEILTVETIERIGCDRSRDVNLAVVRICMELRRVQDRLRALGENPEKILDFRALL